ncbi:TetR/AcrR family transcriptional regulator, partial [Kitasatospora sp. NPDC059571]|uniref:TetR/AcrR family transcriptional regulator n=1 Tax=Kitasatospora sp. NPDC059571 TaxID=3346871 RepID=UPI0036842CEA
PRARAGEAAGGRGGGGRCAAGESGGGARGGLFTARGYDGTGMEELAKRLGISKSSIYHHVSGKEELLELAVGRALNALLAAVEEEQRAGSAVDRLERTVRRSVEVLAADLPYVTLLLRVRGNSPVEIRALERRREFDRRIAELMRQAAAEGGLRRDIEPGLAGRLLFGTVNSLVEWYRPDGDLPVQDLADALTSLVLGGLRS